MKFNIIYMSFIMITEYVSSFAIFLGACKTIERIFRYPIKKYNILSALFALIHPVVVFISLEMGIGIMSEITILIFSFIIWTFFTDKSLLSLLISLIATVFSSSVCYGASSVNIFLYDFLGLNGSVAGTATEFFLAIFCNMVGYFVALAYILLISYIGKGESDEPVSIWNMIALMVAALLSCSFMMNAYDENNNIYQTVLLGYIGMSVSVALSMKSSESKFYSRISRVNANYLNAQKKYYDSRRKADNEIRRIKHDMKNHMICMNELCKKGEYDELENYISGIAEMLNESDKSIHVGNDIADAIINDKLAKAKRSDTKLTVSGTFDTTDFAPIDVCTILANLLDNAIEAVELLDISMHRIDLSFKRNEHFILITVSNPNDTFVDVSRTAKLDKANHGFGISNAKKSAEKYGGDIIFNCETIDDGYLFTAEVVLPRKP